MDILLVKGVSGGGMRPVVAVDEQCAPWHAPTRGGAAKISGAH
jgi:hypothetical protein